MTLPSGSRSADAFSVVGMTLAGGAPRVQAGVARHAALHDLAQRGRELSRLFSADKARKRLLHDLVGTEAEQLRDRVVRQRDLAFKVRNKDRVRGVLDQAYPRRLAPCRARACRAGCR